MLSKEYEKFKILDKNGRVCLKNRKNWNEFIKSPDDLEDLVSNCIKKHPDYFCSRTISKLLKYEIGISSFMKLFKYDTEKIVEFVRKYEDFKIGCNGYAIPFKIKNSDGKLLLCLRARSVQQRTSIPLTGPPANEKQGDQPSRPSVIMYAERPSGQQPDSEQADINTGVQSSDNAEQSLDLRVDSAKKRKYDFESRVEEVSVEKTTLKRRSC